MALIAAACINFLCRLQATKQKDVCPRIARTPYDDKASVTNANGKDIVSPRKLQAVVSTGVGI
jgi:hypothetical protein